MVEFGHFNDKRDKKKGGIDKCNLFEERERNLYFCIMETNRQKKIGALLQNDLVSILQGEIRKNNINNLIISVSKVNVTSDLSIAKVHLSIFPTDKAS